MGEKFLFDFVDEKGIFSDTEYDYSFDKEIVSDTINAECLKRAIKNVCEHLKKKKLNTYETLTSEFDHKVNFRKFKNAFRKIKRQKSKEIKNN